jgi:hypothetical protein
MNPQKVDYNRMDEDNNIREEPQIKMEEYHSIWTMTTGYSIADNADCRVLGNRNNLLSLPVHPSVRIFLTH